MLEFRCLKGNFSKMAPVEVLLCLMYMPLLKKAETIHLENTYVNQERDLISVNVGDNVTLQCSYDHNVARYYWFNQSLGKKLKLISMSNKFNNHGRFYGEFENNSRFTLEAEIGKSQLKISDLKFSDTGTYFCGIAISYVVKFGEGVMVSVKDSVLENKAFVHQPDSESAQLGGTVTLACTVQTGSCSEEHRVFWFRSFLESDQELFYIHGGNDGQCVRNPDTETHTCGYNLAMRNLNKSHVGTYHCTVASCGRIMFGNGTKVDLEPEAISLVMVCFLTATLTFTTILCVLLIIIVDKINNKHSNHTSEFKQRLSAHPTSNKKDYQDKSCLPYIPSRADQSKMLRRQRKSTETECIYSSTKQ